MGISPFYRNHSIEENMSYENYETALWAVEHKIVRKSVVRMAETCDY